MCFGELFLQCGEICSRYLRRVMDIILLSIEGVFHITDSNYAEILQESIVETLMCIYHGMSAQGTYKPLIEYIPYIYQFVTFTTDKARRPKLDYVTDTIVLLTDIYSFYPQDTRFVIQQQFVIDRLDIMVRYNNDGHLTDKISFIKKAFGLL